MRKIKIFLEILIVIFLFLVLIFSFTPLKIGICQGSSMEPALKEGDLIILVKFSPNYQIKEGDIVTYQLKDTDEKISHRIMAILPQEIVILKGDANNYLESVAVSEIKEIVLFKIPSTGTTDFVFFLKKHSLAMIALSIILIVILFFLILTRKKEVI